MRASAAAVVGIMTNLVGAGLGADDRRQAQRRLHPPCLGCLRGRGFGRTPPAPLASGEGLRLASMTFALVYLWAAVHFALAARTIRKDMA